MVAINDTAWFAMFSADAVRDFFALVEATPHALHAALETLELTSGFTPSGGLAHEVAEARARLARAKLGDWQPQELYLRQIGSHHAAGGLPLSAWYEIAARFSRPLTARAVELHADEPTRLADVLGVLSHFIERSISIISATYYAAKLQRENEVRARHRRLIDGALDPVIEIDEHDRVVEINPLAERTFGYRRGEALGKPLASLILPERLREPRGGIARYLATSESRVLGKRVQVTARRADGVELEVELSLVATDRIDGGTGFICFLRDLTEEHRTAAALARSAARAQILSSIGHEFAAASGDTEALLALVARRLGEVIGEGCAVRLLSDDGATLAPSASFYHRDAVRSELARNVLGSEPQPVGQGLAGRAVATGEPVLVPEVDLEAFLAATAPAFRPMLAQLGVASALAVPLRSNGRVIGAVSLLRSAPGDPYTQDDLHLAQELADRAGLAIDNAILVERLEHRVAQRTAALEAVNQELEAFSYSVSHDLRTPLRGIDGFSRALLMDYRDQLDDKAQHYLQRIRAGAQRMSELIDDLLDLARITRVPLKRADHDLSALATEIVAELRRRDPAREVEVDIAPGLHAHVDRRMFRIALENLFDNAWKFTAKQPRAAIWFGQRDGAFVVRDNGVGFDMAYAQKLFTPFQRLHAEKDYDGTGIGLATVHRIIARHSGRIWAEAEVGNGATFSFTLDS